jgi:hypothetical protein
MRRRIGRAAMSVAVAGGALLATAGPASAEGGDHAFAVQDVNGYYAPLGQLGYVADGSSPYVSSGITLPGLLTTGAAANRATPQLASTQLASVIVRVNSRVTVRATGLRSWCRVSDSNALSDGATLASGSVLQIGGTTIPLPTHPAPGTVVTFAGGSLVLNDQPNNPGNVQVYAMTIFGTGGEQIQLGYAYCDSFR